MLAPLLALLATLLATLLGCGTSSGASMPMTKITVAGYTVPWDKRSTVADGRGVLSIASPQWYVPTTSGQLRLLDGVSDQDVRAIEDTAAAAHVVLMPSITDYTGRWNGALISHILSNANMRAAHIATIIQTVRAHGWAGVDLDYESLPELDRNAYSAFVSDLADALHQAHARLSLTVHAKTSEPGDWYGARAENWHALGASADEVRIMAYDYTTLGDPPGPIAPVHWVEHVLALATQEIPRKKIMLGLPMYGYDWVTGQQQSKAAMNNQDLRWADVTALAQAHHATIQWDTTAQEPWFHYVDDQGRQHTVWYENARSMQTKLHQGIQAGIGGVFLWRLGGEDPAVWPALAKVAGPA